MHVHVQHDVWLQACRAQQRVEMGESNQAPQGTQEDLNSSIITESQAAAMSPDCCVPVELSLSLSVSLSLTLFMSPPLYLSLSPFGTGDHSRLQCCSRPLASTLWQGPNTCTNTHAPMHTHIHVRTPKPRRSTSTHTGIGTRPSLSYLSAAHVPHMCKAFT